MTTVADASGAELAALADRLVRFDTTGGNEAPAQDWLEGRFRDLGFETYRWEADPDRLAAHPSFPAAGDLDVAGRPSVAGVLELGDPDAGPTIVLNGHVDVVPAAGGSWSTDPFEPRRSGDRLIGRGACDMKSQLAAMVFAARHLADGADGLDGRVVVESVAGEEEGGIGAAAALSNPYPFERDAAVVTEPTDLALVTATEGCLMARLRLEGRSAHAARKARGVDVLPRFEHVRRAFEALEADRAERVRHPLFDRFENPWPVVIGRVRAGTWASNVADVLEAELRAGVAPGETVDAVAAEFREALEGVAVDDDWLRSHPPTLERFGIQFAPAEVDADEPVVSALVDAMAAAGLDPTPTGETYGTDARFYVEAGIPTAVFGPGLIEEAHFPDESIHWSDVERAADVLSDAVRRFLAADG